MLKSIGPPAATAGNRSPNSWRYAGVVFSLARTAWRMGSFRKPLESGGGTGEPFQSSHWSNAGQIVPAKTRGAFRRWKCETLRVIEGISRGSEEPAVPHQPGKECDIDCSRRPPLIPRTSAIVAHDVIVLDPDGDRLTVAEAIRRRMASGAGVIVMQRMDLVEPQQPPKIGQF